MCPRASGARESPSPQAKPFRASVNRTPRSVASVPVSRRSQVAPPSLVARHRPLSPTIQPCRSSTKQTPRRSAAAAAAGSGATSLEIDEGFDRAWRRVGLALDRSSFTVEDRDRAAGLYFVRWVDPKTLPKDDESLLSRLFGGERGGQPQRVRVLVKAEGGKTRVSVLNTQGGTETGEVARAIVAALERELR